MHRMLIYFSFRTKKKFEQIFAYLTMKGIKKKEKAHFYKIKHQELQDTGSKNNNKIEKCHINEGKKNKIKQKKRKGRSE